MSEKIAEENEQALQEQFREQMRAIGSALDEVFNGPLKGEDRKVGWALLVFPFDCPPGARTNYISNASRKEMLDSMKEFIARAEGRISDSEELQ